MKTIGIVGGLAWPSTIIYYRTINEEIAKRLGGSGRHSAKLLLAQTDFDEVEKNQTASNWDKVGDLLAAEANHLQAGGADFFILACNTVHTAFDRISSQTNLPCIHIVDPAAQKAIDLHAKTVGLIGSGYTMDGTYFTDRLKDRYGLKVILPESGQKEYIHQALYQEFVKGIFLPKTREKFRDTIQSLVDRGAEAIILGCTEFGILLNQSDCTVPLIDTTVEHAKTAAAKALEE